MHFISPENAVPTVPSATAYGRNDLRRQSTVPKNHATVPGATVMTSDPFELLYQPTCSTQLYISGRLTLLRIPYGVCGDWTNLAFITSHASWHRRLDANAFLWLRSAVRRTIESGKLSAEFADAESRLEQIATIGITDGAFTADEIATQRTAPEWYSFNDGLPTWADEIEPDFLPPAKTKHKAALTESRS